MLRKLKKIICGKPPIEMNHEFFGKILFMGGDITKEDDYWEAELEIKEAKEPITVLIKTGKEGPNIQHVAFYKKCVSDLDTLFDNGADGLKLRGFVKDRARSTLICAAAHFMHPEHEQA